MESSAAVVYRAIVFVIVTNDIAYNIMHNATLEVY